MRQEEATLALLIPGGIEAQEARGQRDLVASEALPIKLQGATRKQLTEIGFVFGDDIDELFVSCQLPPGWKKEATEHSMHSNLLDASGSKRGNIFYKAAFYDRKADMWMRPRYSVDAYVQVGDNYEIHVMDAVGKVSLRSFGSRHTTKYEINELRDAEREAYAWLTEQFPEYQDTLAYW